MDKTINDVDFLIVGQGLAGSLLGWFLMQRGLRVLIVDNFHKGASSMVAAGIINPITGRRLVKSWMVDELLPVARKTYREIEKSLDCSVYKERTIYRALKDIKAENQWDERSADDGYAPFMGEEHPTKEVQELWSSPLAGGRYMAQGK